MFSNANGVRPEAGATPMLIDLDDPAHRRRRQLVAEGFTPRRVRAQEPKVRAVVDRLIDQVCEAGECDFVWDLAAWLPLVMIGDALGVDPADHPTLMTWSDDLLRGQGTTDEDLLMKMIAAFSGYTEYATRVIDDRRGCPRDDLMSVLVHAEVDGERLDHDSLIYDSLLILIGGDETTRHVISGGAYQLLTDRAQWERLLADRTLVTSAVEEMLRWVSPIKNMARTATRTTDFHGTEIREGEQAAAALPVGEPRREPLRRPVPLRHHAHARTITSRSASARTSASAARSRASSCASCSSSCSNGSPTCTSSTPRSPRTDPRTSSAATRPCGSRSPRPHR